MVLQGKVFKVLIKNNYYIYNICIFDIINMEMIKWIKIKQKMDGWDWNFLLYTAVYIKNIYLLLLNINNISENFAIVTH